MNLHDLRWQSKKKWNQVNLVYSENRLIINTDKIIFNYIMVLK